MGGIRSAEQRVSHAAAQAMNTALARGARSYPSAALARDGFVVHTDFFARSETVAMMADLQRFGDRAVRTTGVAGTMVRDRADRQSRDLNARQLVERSGSARPSRRCTPPAVSSRPARNSPDWTCASVA